MESLLSVLQDADRHGIAIGHFNISESVSLSAVAAAARELKVPVIIGLSEGERKFFGTRQAAALVKAIREEHDQPIYLNARPYALDRERVGSRTRRIRLCRV